MIYNFFWRNEEKMCAWKNIIWSLRSFGLEVFDILTKMNLKTLNVTNKFFEFVNMTYKLKKIYWEFSKKVAKMLQYK